MAFEPPNDSAEISAEGATGNAAADAPIVATLVAPPSAVSILAGPQFLHPTSILFDLLSSIGQLVMTAVVAFVVSGTNSLFALFAAAVVVSLAGLRAVVRYFTLKYQLVDTELRINEGFFFRRQRTVPVARIQNIDLLQNPVHHFFGVAEVRIETAGGSEPEARLRVLSLSDVDRLRNAVFQGLPVEASTAADAENEGSSATPHTSSMGAPLRGTRRGAIGGAAVRAAVPDELIHRITTAQLIQAGLISNRGFILIPVVFGFIAQVRPDGQVATELVTRLLPRELPNELSWGTTIFLSVLGTLLVLAILRAASVGWFILRFHGYRLERHGDDLRVTCGLFTRVSATVPRRRIQFISVQQTVFGRWFGLATLRLETAGGAGQGNEDAAVTVARRWFLPVLPREDAFLVLRHLRPGLDLRLDDLDWQPTAPRTARRLVRVAIIRSVIIALAGLLAAGPWGLAAGLVALVPLIYLALAYARSLKYARSSDWIVFRSGILTRKTSLTFFDKVQNASVSQTPFDRRWDMATLWVDTAAAGPAQHRIRVRYLPTSVATAELTQISLEASRTQLSPVG